MTGKIKKFFPMFSSFIQKQLTLITVRGEIKYFFIIIDNLYFHDFSELR